MGILYTQDMLGLAGGVLGSYAAEGCFHLLVIPLFPDVGFWVKARAEAHKCSKLHAKLLPKSGDKLMTTTRHYVLCATP